MKPSPESDQAICSSCGKRPATNYICYGGTGKSEELCDDCINTEDPTSAVFTSEAKSAKCVYCGGIPCCGGTDTLSQITGGQFRNRWMCMSCSPEYYAFMQGAFSGIAEGLTQEEQIKLLTEVGAKTEAHMIAFVRRRDN
jgi:protein-arginine kinase activator protein McsA